MKVLATPDFMEDIEDELDDLAFWELQDYVLDDPERGKLIPGSGGLRKLRWRIQGRGKRGGLRVIYYYRTGDLIVFLAAYRKSEKENLSQGEIKELRREIEEAT